MFLIIKFFLIKIGPKNYENCWGGFIFKSEDQYDELAVFRYLVSVYFCESKNWQMNILHFII